MSKKSVLKKIIEVVLMKRINKIMVSGLILLVLLPGVFAVKDLLVLQGSVKDSDGVPVDDGNLTVEIYDAPTGGVLQYNSTTDYINQIQNGEFSINVGNGSNELDLIMNGIYYLDLAVNNVDLDFKGQERQQFQSAVGNITNLSNVVYLSGGSVGIGTTSPSNKLSVYDVDQSYYTGRPAYELMQLFRNNTDAVQMMLGTRDNRFMIRYNSTDSLDQIQFVDGGDVVRVIVANGGNVGIGTASPSELLDIDGNLRLRASEPIINGSLGNMKILAEDSLTITMDSNSQDAGGETISFKSDPSNTVMTITEGNKVGINITNPKAALHVKSVIRIGVEAGFFETVAASGEACDTACEADDASVGGFHASSGSCLKAWNDGGAETRDCSSTAAGTKHCLCTGAY